MKAQGKVISVKDNDTAIVVSKRSSACASCSQCENKGMCHAELVFGSENSDVVEITVLNKIGAKEGDVVEIQASSSRTLFAALVVFVLPVILSLLSGFILQSFAVSGGVLICISFFILLFCFAAFGKLMNNYTKRKIISSIVKILEESDDSFEREQH